MLILTICLYIPFFALLYVHIYVFIFIQKRMEQNWKMLVGTTNNLYGLAMERRGIPNGGLDNYVDLLAKRQNDSLGFRSGVDAGNGDKDSHSSQEDSHACLAIQGSSIPVKNAVRPIKLPEVKRLPPYTTWIFLDRCVKTSVCF